MTLGETQPLEVGSAHSRKSATLPKSTDTIFRLRQGDDSAPIRTDKRLRGALREEHPARASGHPCGSSRQGALRLPQRESRRTGQVGGPRSGASRQGRRRPRQSGEIDGAGREGQRRSSHAPAQSPDVGTAAQLSAAFTLPVGQTGDALFLGANWVVYRVLDHQQPNPDDLAKQRQDITQQLLDARREMAFEAFHSALDNRMKQDGTLRINAENLKRITTSATS